MESAVQGKQRSITLQSFDVISLRRPDIHCFNRISVWCPKGNSGNRRFVTPDHTIVIHSGPVPLDTDPVYLSAAVQPILAVNYVSADCPRPADFERQRREAEAGITYSLVFDADRRSVTGYHLTRPRRYVPLKCDEWNRLAVPELDLEVLVRDGWMRYWFRGELMPLATELAERLAQRED
jgi:hypothetical protein